MEVLHSSGQDLRDLAGVSWRYHPFEARQVFTEVAGGFDPQPEGLEGRSGWEEQLGQHHQDKLNERNQVGRVLVLGDRRSILRP